MQGDLFGRVACANKCGEWWAREALERRLDWPRLRHSQPDVLSLIGVPWSPIRCPICATVMDVRLAGVVAFDHCDAHGVWLDRCEPAAFEVAFGIELTA